MTEKQDYTRSLNEIAKRYGKMENATARGIIDMLAESRRDIIASLATAEGPEQIRLSELEKNLDRRIQELSARAESDVRSAIRKAAQDGMESVVSPLSKLGFRTGFLTPTESQLNTLLSISADLVKGITEPIRASVNLQIRQAALGQISNTQAMENITRIFGTRHVQQGRMVVSGISAKAESSVRTELQRVFNLSNHAQQLKSSQTIDGLLKRWIATGDTRTRESHLNAHVKYKNNPIPVTEPFVLKTLGKPEARLMYPADPSGPPHEVISCRCRLATIHPEIGVIGSSLDGRIANVLKKRASEYARIDRYLAECGRYTESKMYRTASSLIRASLRG